MTRDRAQANLAALAVAVVLLVAAAGVGVAVADAALGDDGSEAARERRLAELTAARLVSTDGPLAVRPQVLDAGRTAALDAAALPPPLAESDAAVRIRLGERTIFERGRLRDGTGVRRLVLAGEATSVTERVNLSAPSPTVPPGISVVSVVAAPGNNTTVTTLRADGRVLRHDPTGVEGSQRIRVDHRERTRVVATTRGNRTGTVTVRYRRLRDEPTTLAVTVDV